MASTGDGGSIGKGLALAAFDEDRQQLQFRDFRRTFSSFHQLVDAREGCSAVSFVSNGMGMGP
jgi:hypothetical protein